MDELIQVELGNLFGSSRKALNPGGGHPPPPLKNVGWLISEYMNCKKSTFFFALTYSNRKHYILTLPSNSPQQNPISAATWCDATSHPMPHYLTSKTMGFWCIQLLKCSYTIVWARHAKYHSRWIFILEYYCDCHFYYSYVERVTSWAVSQILKLYFWVSSYLQKIPEKNSGRNFWYQKATKRWPRK